MQLNNVKAGNLHDTFTGFLLYYFVNPKVLLVDYFKDENDK